MVLTAGNRGCARAVVRFSAKSDAMTIREKKK